MGRLVPSVSNWLPVRSHGLLCYFKQEWFKGTFETWSNINAVGFSEAFASAMTPLLVRILDLNRTISRSSDKAPQAEGEVSPTKFKTFSRWKYDHPDSCPRTMGYQHVPTFLESIAWDCLETSLGKENHPDVSSRINTSQHQRWCILSLIFKHLHSTRILTGSDNLRFVSVPEKASSYLLIPFRLNAGAAQWDERWHFWERGLFPFLSMLEGCW